MAQRRTGRGEDFMRTIDFVFYNERAIRDAVQKARMKSLLNSSFLVRVGAASKLNDPTATLALRNLTPLAAVTINDGEIVERPESWLEVIDKTYNFCAKCNDRRLEVAKRRYRREDYRKTCADLEISNTTRRRLLELVKIHAVLQAVQLGLIEV